MTFSSDMDFEGHVVPIDMETADRLLAGTVAPEDAPPGYAEVTRLLEAVWAEPKPDEIASEAEVVAMIADVVRSSSNAPSFPPHKRRKPFALTRRRITAVVVAAGLASSAGLASAGALPDAIQGIASATLAKIGISVPDPNDSAPKQPKGPAEPRDTPSGAGKSGESSAPATPTGRTVVEKHVGPTASVVKRRAGQHRSGSARSSRADTGDGSGSSPAPRVPQPTGVENRARHAPAASASKGRSAQHRSVSGKSSSSSKARAVAPNAGGRSAAAAEPRRKSQARALPANAGNGGSGAPRAENASSGQGGGGSGGQGGGGSGGQGGGGSGGQGTGGSGNGNSGDPRGP